jgi:hypothetical protein
MSLEKWSALGTFTTAIAGASTAPTLKALANNAGKLGNAIDLTGSSDRQMFAHWDLYVRGAAAFTAGGSADLYLVPAVDGTNYADGGDSTQPPAACFVGSFDLAAVATQQRRVLLMVPLPHALFKPLLWNSGGQAFTNTDNENVLSYRTFTPESV